MAVLDSLAQIILPKGKGRKGGAGFVPGFNPQREVMTAPQYRQHLVDIYNSRQSNDSRTLLNDLVNHDPDVSAAVHAYLTIAGSSQPVLVALGADGQVDPAGIELASKLMAAITTTNDYTIGFSAKPTVDALLTEMRYWLLLRGQLASELVLDKTYTPSELRLIDPATIEWRQKQNGVYSPVQKPAGTNQEIDLNIPTFFTSNYHQNPTDVYTYSPFVAALNTIAARQQVINELYRIMTIVGYPRLDVAVLEDVLLQNAPPAFRTDPKRLRQHVEEEVARVRASINSLSSGQALVHSNAVEAKIINDKNPGAGLQIQGVIDVLDSQNQAALKVMPAVVGKTSNINTASTEARLFALSADAINKSVAGGLSKGLTLGARLSGYQGRIEVRFPPVELRPAAELEPQWVMKAARLKQDLSLGLITDIEYHMEMYGRPPPAGAPQLSGTGFMEAQAQAANVDTQNISPNDDSLGRSLAPEGGKSAKSNAVKQ
jgi:hypothetical protein